MQKNKLSKGFTMIELIVVVFIIGFISVLSFTGLTTYKYDQVHKNNLDNTLSLLNKARTKALSGENARDYNININSVNKTFTLTLVQTDVNDPTYSETLTLDNQTTITETITGSDINFTRFTGATNNTGNITLTTTSGGFSKASTIKIYPTGLAAIE